MEPLRDIHELLVGQEAVSSPDTTREEVPIITDCDSHSDSPSPTVATPISADGDGVGVGGGGSSTFSGSGSGGTTGGGSRRDRKNKHLSPRDREMLRLKINHRERERMHDLNSSMDALRQVMPYAHGPSVKKLSKMATLLLARNYIILLTRSLEEMRRLLAESYRQQLLVSSDPRSPPDGLPVRPAARPAPPPPPPPPPAPPLGKPPVPPCLAPLMSLPAGAVVPPANPFHPPPPHPHPHHPHPHLPAPHPLLATALTAAAAAAVAAAPASHAAVGGMAAGSSDATSSSGSQPQLTQASAPSHVFHHPSASTVSSMGLSSTASVSSPVPPTPTPIQAPTSRALHPQQPNNAPWHMCSCVCCQFRVTSSSDSMLKPT